MMTYNDELPDMIRTNDVTSVSEFRRAMRERLDQIRSSGRPLYLTSNGETEAVLLPASVFDRLLERLDRAETALAIREGLEDVEAGRVEDAESAMRRVLNERLQRQRPT